MADDDFKTQLELEAVEKEKETSQASGVTDPYLYTDPNDGTVYEWNHGKQAWFPKIDDDFIAKYQANYQYQNDVSEECSEKETTNDVPQPANKLEKKKANDPCWFNVDDAHNTNVYVSGIPASTTEEEFIELMGKCGLIMKDPDTMKYKIKLYRNEDGTLKGDGRCCYIKIESVGLALDILDGYLFKNKQIHVERAQFKLKGTYDPAKKPKKKKTRDKEKLKKKLDKLFDWRPDKLRGMRERHEKTVVIKNMFDPKEFEDEATLILEYRKDLREECSRCGEVKKVVIYDRHPEGVVSVTFAEPEMADECIKMMNGRWFAARQLKAETWDGKTKYKVIETEGEREKRMKDWENYLQEDENKTKLPSAQAEGKQNTSNCDLKDTQAILENAYEMAGETESSGDSDDAGDHEDMKNPVVSTSNYSTPVSSEL